MKWDWDPTKWLIWLFHNFTNQIPTVKIASDDEVERARERVRTGVNELKLSSRCEKPSLPVVHEGDVLRRFEGQPFIILDGFVVDVNLFSDKHPGGKQVLEAGSGKDMSEGFRKLNHHSRHARDMAESMRIAKVVAQKADQTGGIQPE